VAIAEDASDEDDGGAGFDEEFAAVEPINGRVFEAGVGEEGMPEEGDGAEVNGEVESFPEMAAEADAEIGRDDEDDEDVQSDGAEGVFERLLRGVDRIDEIDEAEVRGFVEEQHEWVRRGEEEGQIAGPVVEAEVVEAAMGPGALGAVAENHERAEEHVDRDGADGNEAEIGGEVEERDGHGNELSIIRENDAWVKENALGAGAEKFEFQELKNGCGTGLALSSCEAIA